MTNSDRLAFLETLFTPLVSDTMDRLGITGYVFDHTIQSILPDPHLRVAGFAFPCRVVPTTEYVEIHKLLEMVDAIPSDSIVLVSSDADIDAALWGGLMSTRAKSLGARAAIVGGGVRDIAQISALGFPVFGIYRCVKDIRRRGYMAEYDIVVEIGGVRVRPGDIIFADANGVVCIPSEHSDVIFDALRTNLRGEERTAADLLLGKKAVDVFGEYGTF